MQGEGGAEGEAALAVRGGGDLARSPALHMAPHVARALRHHADLGDVQTPAVVMLALQDHRWGPALAAHARTPLERTHV